MIRTVTAFPLSARSLGKALPFCLLAVVAAAFLLLETADAQGEPDYDYVDLVMLYEQAPERYSQEVRYRVKNNGSATATGVTVSFLLEDLEVNEFEGDDTPPADIRDIRTEDRTNQGFTWVVGTIPPGGTSGSLAFSTKLHSGRHSEVDSMWPGRIGVITATPSSLSPEPGILLANNVAKVYSFAADTARSSFHMEGGRLALLLSVDDLQPAPEGDVDFDLTADNQYPRAVG